MIPRACVAVKMSKELFARGILKNNDRPLDDQSGAVTVILDGETDMRYCAHARLHSIRSCSVCHMRDDVAGVRVVWFRMCPRGFCCNTGRPDTRCLTEYAQLAEWHYNLNTIHFCGDVCVKAYGCLPHDEVVCWEDMVDNVAAHSHKSDSGSDSEYSSDNDE